MAQDQPDRLAQQVALEVLLNGPLSRSEIARRLNLAPATLTRISSDLIRHGIVTEVQQDRSPRSGRPAVPVDVIVDAQHFLGAKIGSDSITAVLTNLRAEVLTSTTLELKSCTPIAVVAALSELVSSSWAEQKIDGIGVGIGGVISNEGVVLSAPFLGWRDVPIQMMIREELGIPTTVANDLAAFTQALHWFGEGSGRDNVAVISLGIGVGFGCIANGQLLAGPDYGVGLIGHWPIDPLGPLCTKGHRGCAEALLSIPMIERDVSTALGYSVRWADVLRLSAEENETATRVVAQSGHALGVLIGLIANLTAPEVVIVGGEGVLLAKVAWDEVRTGVASVRDPRADPVPVVLTSEENNSWARGAAVIAIQDRVLEGLRG